MRTGAWEARAAEDCAMKTWVFWLIGLVVLMVGIPAVADAYHTPDHFCDQCVVDNCSGGGNADLAFIDCVSMSCGDQCRVWAVDRFSPGEGCMAQCEEMWQSCLAASEDSAGLIDDYCVQTAQACYAGCQNDPSNGVADDFYGESP